MTKKAYKIKDLRSGKYISIGYKPKSTWNKFPSQVMENNRHIIPKESKDFVVDVFELVQVNTVAIDGSEIINQNQK